ncbi:MAG: hypothetical protein Q9188_006117 [Gyalolechia gomerana]
MDHQPPNQPCTTDAVTTENTAHDTLQGSRTPILPSVNEGSPTFNSSQPSANLPGTSTATPSTHGPTTVGIASLPTTSRKRARSSDSCEPAVAKDIQELELAAQDIRALRLLQKRAATSPGTIENDRHLLQVQCDGIHDSLHRIGKEMEELQLRSDHLARQHADESERLQRVRQDLKWMGEDDVTLRSHWRDCEKRYQAASRSIVKRIELVLGKRKMASDTAYGNNDSDE